MAAAWSMNIVPGEASEKSEYEFGKYVFVKSTRFCFNVSKSLPTYDKFFPPILFKGLMAIY